MRKAIWWCGLDKDKFRLHQQSVDEVCGVSKVLLQQFAEILIYYDSRFNLFEDYCRSRIARGIALALRTL
jgi:hypothetical protein